MKLDKWHEELEDPKEVIRIRKCGKYKQHNDQVKNDPKMTNHNLQNIYIKQRLSNTNPTKNGV